MGSQLPDAGGDGGRRGAGDLCAGSTGHPYPRGSGCRSDAFPQRDRVHAHAHSDTNADRNAHAYDYAHSHLHTHDDEHTYSYAVIYAYDDEHAYTHNRNAAPADET